MIDSKVADQWWMWAGIASMAPSSRAWARMQTARRRKLKCKNWGSKTMMMMSNSRCAVFDRTESGRNAGRRSAGGNDSDGFETMPAAVEQWLISKLRCLTGRLERWVWKRERENVTRFSHSSDFRVWPLIWNSNFEAHRVQSKFDRWTKWLI